MLVSTNLFFEFTSTKVFYHCLLCWQRGLSIEGQGSCQSHCSPLNTRTSRQGVRRRRRLHHPRRHRSRLRLSRAFYAVVPPMWLLLHSLGEQAIPRARLLLSLSHCLRSRSCSRAACCLQPTFTSRQRSLHSTQCRHRGAFCARPSPRGRLFVDCRVQRVQFGAHGGPDRDRSDHRHIVIVMSTAM